MEFTDLTYTVSRPWLPTSKAYSKVILKSISGKFRFGELSAILGPSGAGKTSLLNAISGYKKAGVEGSLTLNGLPRDENKFKKISCFISQEDALQPRMTLQELMLFAANLKLPPQTNYKQKLKTIYEVQFLLGLEGCKDVSTEHLSGGQRKRLSIALELVNNPPIVFLDEPTSGLDNVSAGKLVRLLRVLAHQGRAIVVTIHQPSASLFELFDHAYFLSAGQCVFQGHTKELLPFLSSVGLPCPKHNNPADFIIEMTDREFEENIEVLASATDNGKISRIWGGSSIVQLNDNALTDGNDTILHGESKRNEVEVSKIYDSFSNTSCLKDLCELNTSWWHQFYTILCRMLLQIRRNRVGLLLQIIHHFGCAISLGIVFRGVAVDGDEFFSQMKFCIVIIIFHTYTYIMVPVLHFPSEVKLLKKEHFNQWYKLGPYYTALIVSKLPTIGPFSFIFQVIAYGASGLPWETERFLVFCLAGTLVAMTSESFGLAVGSVFNVTNGSAVAPLSMAPFLGFAIYGFDFARSISWWMWILTKTSYMRTGGIAMALAIYGLGREKMNCNDPMYCHFQDPKVTIYYLNLEETSPWSELGYLFLTMAACRVLLYIGLRWRLRT